MCCGKTDTPVLVKECRVFYYRHLTLMHLMVFNPQFARGFVKRSEHTIGTLGLRVRIAEAAAEPASSRGGSPSPAAAEALRGRAGRAASAGSRGRAGRAVSRRGRVGKRRRAPRGDATAAFRRGASILTETTP